MSSTPVKVYLASTCGHALKIRSGLFDYSHKILKQWPEILDVLPLWVQSVVWSTNADQGLDAAFLVDLIGLDLFARDMHYSLNPGDYTELISPSVL